MFVRLLTALACTLGLVLPAHAWPGTAHAAPVPAPAEQTAPLAAPAQDATSAQVTGAAPVSLTAQPAPEAGPADASGPASGAVVIGSSGLSLEDLSPETTPHLWRMAEEGATGNLAVRTLTPATCAASGWLSLGAGARMRGADLTPAWQHPLFLDRACPRMLEPTSEAADAPESTGPQPTGLAPAAFSEFHRVDDLNATGGYGALPGAFTHAADSALAREGAPDADATPPAAEGAQAGRSAEPSWCTAAVGTGAGYAAADPEGQVGLWSPLSTLLDEPEDADERTREKRAAERTALLSACSLTLVDAGTAADPLWDPAASALWSEATLGTLRSAQIQELDDRVGLILESVPDDYDVVVAGLGDSAYPSRLRALLATGPSYPGGTLTASSTRQAGLTQLTDVLPAVLRNTGMEAAGSSPAAFTVDTGTAGKSAQERLDSLTADARKAATVHTHAQTFGIVLDVLFYALFLFTMIGFTVPVVRFMRRRSLAARRRADSLRPAAAVAADAPAVPLSGWRTGVSWACFALALLPAASFFAGFLPWGRAPDPALALALSIAAAVVVLLLAAVAGPWRRTWAGRIAAVSLLSALVLLADVALGSRLQFNSLMGYNPIVAGRFYGLGNQGAALFLVASLLGLGIVAARLGAHGRAGWARALTAVYALVSVCVLGNPAWGAKFGGTVAALVGFTVLLLALFRIRVNLLKLAGIGAGALVVIMGVAWLDYLRPPAERSHFGSFFAQALDGELLDVIGRKLGANLRIAVINPGLAIVVPLAVLIVLFALAYLRRSRRTTVLARPWDGHLPEALTDPHVHAGFLSAVLALAVGLVITDSGIAVPATGAMMFVPFLVVLSLDAAQRAEGEDASSRADGTVRSAPAYAPVTPAAAETGEAGATSAAGAASAASAASASGSTETDRNAPGPEATA